MENATKALLIAGGVLLALLTIMVAVYLYNSSTSLNDRVSEKSRQKEIQEFNQNFTRYENYESVPGDSSKRRKIPFDVQDVASMVNLANEYNTKNEYQSGDDKYIEVSVNALKINPNEVEQMIQDNLDKKYVFKTPIEYKNGKVSKVVICFAN